MPVLLSTYQEKDDATQTVTLDAAQYRLRTYWRDRQASWFMDLREADDTEIFLGRRLSPGGDPFSGIKPENGPPGVLWCIGPDAYVRADLGTSLQLWYWPEDEIPEVNTGLDVTVT